MALFVELWILVNFRDNDAEAGEVLDEPFGGYEHGLRAASASGVIARGC